MERIFRAAKQHGYEVFISPHYFYPTDGGRKFNDPLESSEFADKIFARRGALTLEGFSGSGADWLDRFKPYIEDGRTIVVSPHKVWGPQTNDLVLQLRKRRIGKVILGGKKFNDPLESSEFADKIFARRGALTLEGFSGSGADWLDRFKPYIEDGRTIVVSPHKVWGPQTNDLVLQLRKRRIGKVILGG